MSGRPLGRGKIKRGKDRQGRTVYIAQWTGADGIWHRKMLSTERRTAERMLADIIQRRDLQLQGLAHEEQQNLLLEELRKKYLADLRTRVKPSSYRRSEGALTKVLDALKVVRVLGLTRELVLDYRHERLRQGAANRTINLEVGTLKAMFNWTAKNGVIAENPLAGLSRLPQGKAYETRPRRDLPLDEVRRFLEASKVADREAQDRKAAKRTIDGGTKGARYAATDRPPSIPQTPLWRSFFLTGARWGGLTQAAWGDLDEERETLVLRARTMKSTRQQNVPLAREVLEDLVRLKKIHEQFYGRPPQATDPIFLTRNGKTWEQGHRNALRIFKRLLKAAKIKLVDARGAKVDIHSMRHTFCSMLARAGVPLIEAQHLMGHSDPKLTADLYTHLGVTDLRGAIEKLPQLETSGQERSGTDPVTCNKLASGPEDSGIDETVVVRKDKEEEEVTEAIPAGLEPATCGLGNR